MALPTTFHSTPAVTSSRKFNFFILISGLHNNVAASSLLYIFMFSLRIFFSKKRAKKLRKEIYIFLLFFFLCTEIFYAFFIFIFMLCTRNENDDDVCNLKREYKCCVYIAVLLYTYFLFALVSKYNLYMYERKLFYHHYHLLPLPLWGEKNEEEKRQN